MSVQNEPPFPAFCAPSPAGPTSTNRTGIPTPTPLPHRPRPTRRAFPDSPDRPLRHRLNDKKGQRTGYQTHYSENTFAWNHWIGSTVQLRPDLRFDHAWDAPAYDNGNHRSQFTAATDLIFHF